MPQFEVNISFNAIGPEQSRNLPSVIFLHEIASAKETWQPCLHTIANGTGRIVATYDARNHGDSGWTNNFSYEFIMEDLKNVMEYLHMPKAILIGHGMGGKTAMDFALKYPDMVEKLVVEDMTLRFQPPGERGFCLKYIELLQESLKNIPPDVRDLSHAKDFLASYIQPRIPEEYRSEHPQEITGDMIPLEVDPVTNNFEWKLHLKLLEFAVLNGFQLEPDIGEFRIFKYEGKYDGPTLFLYGSISPYKIYEDRDFIIENMKNASFRAIEGGGHLLHTDFKDKFCEEVIEFINS